MNMAVLSAHVCAPFGYGVPGESLRRIGSLLELNDVKRQLGDTTI